MRKKSFSESDLRYLCRRIKEGPISEYYRDATFIRGMIYELTVYANLNLTCAQSHMLHKKIDPEAPDDPTDIETYLAGQQFAYDILKEHGIL